MNKLLSTVTTYLGREFDAEGLRYLLKVALVKSSVLINASLLALPTLTLGVGLDEVDELVASLLQNAGNTLAPTGLLCDVLAESLRGLGLLNALRRVWPRRKFLWTLGLGAARVPEES